MSKNKLLDFNTLCKVLGVQLDLKQSGDGLCFVTNTAERVSELIAEISKLEHAGQERRRKTKGEVAVCQRPSF